MARVIAIETLAARSELLASSSDLYDSLVRQIEQENQVINHRLTWTLQLNGFLFTAMALMGGRPLPDAALRLMFEWLVPLVALCVSAAGLLGVAGAHLQLLYLAQRWEATVSADPRPRPFGDPRHSYLLGALPSVLPPLGLTAVWAALVMFRLVNG